MVNEPTDDMEFNLADEQIILELINETKDYINDLLVCLENEDYQMLGTIENTYAGLQEELAQLPESSAEYYPEEWAKINEQLQGLREVMEVRRDNLREFLERGEQSSGAAKAYERNSDLGDGEDVVLNFNQNELK